MLQIRIVVNVRTLDQMLHNAITSLLIHQLGIFVEDVLSAPLGRRLHKAAIYSRSVWLVAPDIITKVVHVLVAAQESIIQTWEVHRIAPASVVPQGLLPR